MDASSPATSSAALHSRCGCGAAGRAIARSSNRDFRRLSRVLASRWRSFCMRSTRCRPLASPPCASLYQGLSEIALALQGDVVLRRIRDLSPDYPGLVTTSARLRAQLAIPAPIADDIAWAREQLAELRDAQPAKPRGFGARLFGGFGRKGGAARSGDGAVREWEEVVAALVRCKARTSARARRSGAVALLAHPEALALPDLLHPRRWDWRVVASEPRRADALPVRLALSSAP